MKMSEQTIEEKAKTMGHVPKEEWKGDPDKWRPAAEFVERGENIIPILKERHEKLEKKFDNLKSDMDITLKANKREVEEAKKLAFETATENYEAKLKMLDKREIEAFTDGDAAEFQEIKKERQELKKPEEPKQDKTSPENPEFKDWSKKEKWYGADDELTTEANIQGNVLVQKYPDKPISEIYDMITKNVKALHPEKFENPRRKEPNSVEEGGTNIDTAPKGFNALPKSAKAQYKRLAENFKAEGRKYTKEQYAKDWNE